jgi:hypothetical protein
MYFKKQNNMQTIQEWIKEFDYNYPELFVRGDNWNWQSDIKNSVSKLVKETEKAFGGCKSCRGKGYSTNIDRWSGYDEYDGEEYSEATDYYLPCKECERGKQISAMINHYKK